MISAQRLCVRTAATPASHYEVLFGEGLLESVGPLCREHPALQGRGVVLTDDRVGPLYAERVLDSLQKANYTATLITVPSGEKSKSWEILAEVCEKMVAAGLDRSSFLVALGGGVIGDLGGFVAAVYYRGIPFVQIPTTVVAQVDSSVGGKTGLNLQGGKNLLGAFHQPALVVADPTTLRSLPSREFTEGLAEMVKHAAIRDPAMLEVIPASWQPDLTPVLARNVAIKAAIVQADEKETSGERALLNFGHTLGHAIENAAGYGEFLHGEAVSLGLVVALRISREIAGLPAAEEDKVLSTLVRLGLPTHLHLAPPAEALLQAMRTDKKFTQGKIRFVLLRRLGDAFVSSEVTVPILERIIEELRSAHRG